MSVACVYTDLDGTLLGKGGSLFADMEGRFSSAAARGLELCAQADVEVVPVSGRVESRVREVSRLIGQSSYVYEAGCGLVADGARLDLVAIDERLPGSTVNEQIAARGIPQMLLAGFDGRLEYHAPWHQGRRFSHLFRGHVDIIEANHLLDREGASDLRLLDNGATTQALTVAGERARAYHLLPRTASKAAGVLAHADARGHDPEACVAIGDSVEDLEMASVVGRGFIVANGLESGARPGQGADGNVIPVEGQAGVGFLQAIEAALAA